MISEGARRKPTMMYLDRVGVGVGVGVRVGARFGVRVRSRCPHVGLKLALGGTLQDRAPYPRQLQLQRNQEPARAGAANHDMHMLFGACVLSFWCRKARCHPVNASSTPATEVREIISRKSDALNVQERTREAPETTL